MGDTVQYHLERMVPELEDLEKRGLFSACEIKEIVRRRRDFEFLLKRPSPLKQDFLRYVEYEKQLETLRKLKKKILVKGLQDSGRKWQNSLCDRSSAMRIVHIYERAVTRFKGDLSLWLQYVEYCRSQGAKRMQRVLTKVLRLHPTVPGLWIYAAAWEFEHKLNVRAARALMQRGLRMCPRSENLWLEYFHMELTNIQKLQYRKYMLGLSEGDGYPVKGTTITASQGLDSQGQDHSNNATYVQKSTEEMEHDSKVAEKIARTIYQNAVAAVPSNAKFRQQFLELLDSTNFNGRGLEEIICESLAKDFPLDEDCWDWQARRLFGKAIKQVQNNTLKNREALGETCQVYENALSVVASARMYELYSKFLEGILESDAVSSESEGTAEDSNLEMVVMKLTKLYESAANAGIASAILAENHIGLLLRWGKLKNATDLAASLCSDSMRTCGKVWALRLSLKMKALALEEENGAVMDLIQEALHWIPFTEAKPVWELAMEFYTSNAVSIEQLLPVFKGSLARSKDGEPVELTCAIIDWVILSQDMDKARRFYTEILALPGTNVQLFRHCIHIEARFVEMGESEGLHHLQRLFDIAVGIYGKTDVELWCEYWSAEMKAGNIDAASRVYWRARKMLENPSVFTQRVHSV